MPNFLPPNTTLGTELTASEGLTKRFLNFRDTSHASFVVLELVLWTQTHLRGARITQVTK